MWVYLLFLLGLSTDTFVASLSYAVTGIKIPIRSSLVISIVCTMMILLSLLGGDFLLPYVSPSLLKGLSFLILFAIGGTKIFEGSIKRYVRRHQQEDTVLRFSFCNISFLLSIYSDYEQADRDASKVLSIGEALSLAIALSFDGLSAGLALGSSNISYLTLLGMGFGMNFLFIILAKVIGKRLFLKKTIDLSFLSGLLFVVLAFLRLF